MLKNTDKPNSNATIKQFQHTTVKTIALVCAGSWDALQLPRVLPKVTNQYKVVHYGDNSIQANPGDFDAFTFINEIVNKSKNGLAPINGVASSTDYPGCLVAACIAYELRLPGCPIEAAFYCSHKYYSRVAQQKIIPEACPPFTLVSPIYKRIEPLSFPIFLKPVKSVFSMLAGCVNTEEELQKRFEENATENHLKRYVRPFNQLLRHYCPSIDVDGSNMLAEGLLSGEQVTVEGFVFDKKITIIGVVDSVMFPGTISFQRFDYPSNHPQDVQQRMGDICTRIIQYIGLNNTFFNVELFYRADLPAGEDLKIIEINPRMVGEFADLYEGVDGTNTYEVLLAIAAGDKPLFRRGSGRYKVGASFTLRQFQDARIINIPKENDFNNVLQKWERVTIVKSFCNHVGQRLSELGEYDGVSYKYCVLNMVGHSLEEMLEEFELVKDDLGYKFDPVIESS